VTTDEDAFRAFVVARRPALVRSAVLLTGDHHLAEDLVQTALARLALNWTRVSAKGSAESYARRIVFTTHVSWWRRRRIREVLVDPPDAAMADPQDTADRLVLRAALARLTAKQRSVLVLRFYEDLTEVQTARVLGVGVGTVKSQTRHALDRLRELAPELAQMFGRADVPSATSPEVTR
jgi:RNA polymerase sigma-70 factor (sigma-E family)